MISNGSKRF
jgi:hypothetical protein